MYLWLEILEFQYISCYCLSRALKKLVNYIIISIHLMLLFIAFFRLGQVTCLNFNTSHVTVYPLVLAEWKRIDIFQYISCYCLSRSWIMGRYYQKISIHLMLLFIEIWKREQNDEGAFQYISCYCLSADSKRPQNCGLLFQYISCYCLSNELTPFYIFLRI